MNGPGDPRDCGGNRLVTGHVFRLDWYGGGRCWCHNRPLAELQAETAQRGRCEFCRGPGPLVAVLTADPDQRVCAECHADPRVPTEISG